MLRLDSQAAQAGVGAGGSSSGAQQVDPELERIQGSLSRALEEMRAIAAGLRLPDLERLTLAETVTRVVQYHERRTATTVDLRVEQVPEPVPLPIKITVYRLIQEALSNAYRHGGGAAQAVRVATEDGELSLEISDQGPGFDASVPAGDGHLGVAGMRERVESQGGTLEVDSKPGGGTRVQVRLPLSIEDEDDA